MTQKTLASVFNKHIKLDKIILCWNTNCNCLALIPKPDFSVSSQRIVFDHHRKDVRKEDKDEKLVHFWPDGVYLREALDVENFKIEDVDFAVLMLIGLHVKRRSR